MKTLSELKKEGFEGCDVSLEISLFEQGLITKKHPDGSIQCWHGVKYSDKKQGYIKFDSSWTTEEEINNYLDEEWFDKGSFLSFNGMTEDEWKCSDFTIRIYDLLGYYGYENIFGSCYDSVEIENK